MSTHHSIVNNNIALICGLIILAIILVVINIAVLVPAIITVNSKNAGIESNQTIDVLEVKKAVELIQSSNNN